MTNETEQISKLPFYIYVDVDETFIRNVSTKRIPVPHVIEHVKKLKQEGAILYYWSSGGAEYAEASAREVGISECFSSFLPKPHVLLDDHSISKWRRLIEIHPNECEGKSLDDYRSTVKTE